jgi:hypothetical protein
VPSDAALEKSVFADDICGQTGWRRCPDSCPHSSKPCQKSFSHLPRLPLPPPKNVPLGLTLPLALARLPFPSINQSINQSITAPQTAPSCLTPNRKESAISPTRSPTAKVVLPRTKIRSSTTHSPLRPLLVQHPVPALLASDGVAEVQRDLARTLAAGVGYRGLGLVRDGAVGGGVGGGGGLLDGVALRWKLVGFSLGGGHCGGGGAGRGSVLGWLVEEFVYWWRRISGLREDIVVLAGF